MPASQSDLALSILVTTTGERAGLAALLECLDAQTLEPERFELIAVDCGSDEPALVDPARHRFAVRLLRQASRSEVAAANLALQRCRAPLVLALEPGARPRPETLEQHVAAHAAGRGAGPLVVLGASPFSARARQHAFVQVQARAAARFALRELVPDEPRPLARASGMAFHLRNASASTAALRAVGGFDAERFEQRLGAGLDLQHRLERAGARVLYRPDIVCEDETAVDSESWLGDLEGFGADLARIAEKHADPSFLCALAGGATDDPGAALQDLCERGHASSVHLRGELASLQAAYAGRTVPDALLEEVAELAAALGAQAAARGALRVLTGRDPVRVLQAGPPTGKLVSVVLAARDAERTERALAALEACADPRHPMQIVAVDDGLPAEAAERLARRAGLTWVHNAPEAGTPGARNLGLCAARGAWIAFLEDDVCVTPGWLRRMLFHAEVDGRAGCVGCLAERATHGQTAQGARGGFDAARARAEDRGYRRQVLVAPFCVLVGRELVDAIGGFDEWFAPRGSETDDFALRAHLAGFHNRVALDVCVERAEPSAAELARERELGVRGWARFVAKWDLQEHEPSESQLVGLARRRWPLERLQVPIETQPAVGRNILAWPDWSQLAAVEHLLVEVAAELAGEPDRQLVLRVDPAVDGSVEGVRAILDAACRNVFSSEDALLLDLLGDTDPRRALQKALLACSTATTSGSDAHRAQWLARSGLELR